MSHNRTTDFSSGLGAKSSLLLAAAMSVHAVVSRLKLNGIENMSCFNLIAFAFQQSKRLLSLELSSCELSRADMLQLE